MLLKNRTALVTGSSRGIGAATAKLFAEHGAAVAVNYSNSEDAANEVVKCIQDHGGKAIAVKANVTDFEEVKSMIKTVTEKLGAIDTLVLNAGMNFKIAPFLEQEWDDMEKKIMGEMKALFFPIKLVAPSMIEKKRGCIICT